MVGREDAGESMDTLLPSLSTTASIAVRGAGLPGTVPSAAVGGEP